MERRQEGGAGTKCGGNKSGRKRDEKEEQRREKKMRPTTPSKKKSWMASIVEVPSRETDTGSFPGRKEGFITKTRIEPRMPPKHEETEQSHHK